MITMMKEIVMKSSLTHRRAKHEKGPQDTDNILGINTVLLYFIC